VDPASVLAPDRRIVYTSYYGDLDGGGELRMVEHIERSAVPRERYTVIVFKDGELGRRLREMAVDVKVVPWSWRRGRLARLAALPATLLRLRRGIARSRPAVLVCNTFLDLRLAAPVARSLGIPVVWRARGEFSARLADERRVGIPKLARRIDRHVARILPTTRYERRELVEHGIPTDKVVTVHNGVDLARFEAAAERGRRLRAELGYPPETPVVGIVARLTAQKGHLSLLDALHRLGSRGLDCRALIVGDCVEEPEQVRRLKQRTAELGLDDVVRFLGRRRDVPEVMQAIDILVSASTQEPFGTSVIEGMAAGKPVVATATRGPEEIFDDATTGRLVPIGDAAALADALAGLIADPAGARDMGHAAREAVRRRFDLSVTIAELDRWLLSTATR
jgi:glycosyltransferase involved in cell wall biosynthesis